MFVPSITLFQFAHMPVSSDSGGSDVRWLMATLDVRRGEGMEHENSLKLWIWNSAANKYSLAAQVGALIKLTSCED